VSAGSRAQKACAQLGPSPPIYGYETAARKHLEKLQWPDGPECPHCGVVDEATLLKGESTRPGVYKCRACEKPFSVTVGTVFEDSKVPLHKWLYATHLLYRVQERHQLAPAPPYPWRVLQDRVVHVASHP
jgi:hypothetical protein